MEVQAHDPEDMVDCIISNLFFVAWVVAVHSTYQILVVQRQRSGTLLEVCKYLENFVIVNINLMKRASVGDRVFDGVHD